MWKMRKRNGVTYSKILGGLLISLVVSCVVFVGAIAAQDDTPAIPKFPTQATQQIQVTQTSKRSTPVLTIAPLAPQKVGRTIFITATLKNDQGVPQTNKPLLILSMERKFGEIVLMAAASPSVLAQISRLGNISSRSSSSEQRPTRASVPLQLSRSFRYSSLWKPCRRWQVFPYQSTGRH